MFKLLGHALGHSFGLIAMFIATTILGLFSFSGVDINPLIEIVWIIYASGYMLVPFIYIINTLIEGRVKRKAIKVNMYSPEFLKEFEFEMNKYAQKKLNKMAIKEVKKNKRVAIKKEEDNGKELL